MSRSTAESPRIHSIGKSFRPLELTRSTTSGMPKGSLTCTACRSRCRPFCKALSKFMNPQSFIASLSFDIRLAPYDIQGSIAHARMLSKCRIIPARDAQRIIRGLEAILRDLSRGKRLPPEEDIHYAIERELIRRIGPVGGKLHTARSRNDQIALDLRLYLRDQIGQIIGEIVRLQKAIIGVAEANMDVIMP